jgi:hypothetical protein
MFPPEPIVVIWCNPGFSFDELLHGFPYRLSHHIFQQPDCTDVERLFEDEFAIAGKSKFGTSAAHIDIDDSSLFIFSATWFS